VRGRTTKRGADGLGDLEKGLRKISDGRIMGLVKIFPRRYAPHSTPPQRFRAVLVRLQEEGKKKKRRGRRIVIARSWRLVKMRDN